ncbi:MAG: hypothetical protein Q9160_003992 [Pyrenula sp. 1 TL-2023]
MLSRTSSRALPLLRLRHPSAHTPRCAILTSSSISRPPHLSPQTTSTPLPSSCLRRALHSSPLHQKGLQPDTSDPQPPSPEPDISGGSSGVSSSTSPPSSAHNAPSSPSPLTEEQYHALSDLFIEALQTRLEEIAENPDRGVEVEYSSGVLTLTTPHGTYVLNKQPPNRQIWISSPISGPKRYDWVEGTGVGGSGGQDIKEGTEDVSTGAGGVKGMEMGEKGEQLEGLGIGKGRWVYLRDGTELVGLLRREVGVDLEEGGEGEGELGS